MQSLLTLLTFLVRVSSKAWAATVVAVLSCSSVILFYFSSANAGPNPTSGNPTNPTVAVQAGHAHHPGGTLGTEHCTAPLPAVPEANAGLVLIPVVAAMLCFSARRFWFAKPSLAADGQNAKGISEP